MKHLTFRWTHRGEQYEFRGRAETPRSVVQEVDAEIVGISEWLDVQGLQPGQHALIASRTHETAKDESLSFSHGKIHADGGTTFRPVVTDVCLRLPEDAALRFRLAFDIVDRRR